MLESVFEPWVWVAIAFVLGAMMVWLFRSCQAADAEARREAFAGEPLAGDADPAPAGSAAAPGPSAAEKELAALTSAIADLKDRNSALEAQLREAREEAVTLLSAQADAPAPTPAEATAFHAAPNVPMRFAQGVDLSEADGSALRYRIWLLGSRLERLIADAHAGQAVDWSLAAADLDKATAPALPIAATAAAGPAPETEDRTPQLEAQNAELQRELSRLRFERWRGEDAPAPLAAVQAGGEAETLRAQAQTLRARVATLEETIAGLRSAAPNIAPVGAATLATAAADNGKAEAAFDDANALRVKLAQSEAALRAMRAEHAAALKAAAAEPAPLAAPPAETAASDLAAQTLRAENASLRSRLWTSEWRIGELRQAVEAGGGPNVAEELAQAKEEVASLRSRLLTAEYQIREASEARPDAEAADPRLTAQIETLRERLRQVEAERDAGAGDGSAEAADLRRERDALRARAALAEAELEKLKGQPGAATSFANVADVLDVDDGSIAPEGQNAGGLDIDKPLSGAEAAALELIESDAFVADETSRPAGLLAAPNAGAPDDLKQINGVGPRLEDLLNELGVFYFRQIAEFSPSDIAWIDRRLSFKGRIVRDRWLPQAQALVRETGAVVPEPRTAAAFVGAPAATVDLAGDLGPQGAAPVESPLSGAEAAALELIEGGGAGAAGSQPADLLDGPTRGQADPLDEIHGVGPRVATLLNELGIYYFDQLAALGPGGLAWLDTRLSLQGRVIRDRWSPQAARFAAQRAPQAQDAPDAPGAPPAPARPADRLAAKPTPAPAAATALPTSDSYTAVEEEALRLLEAGFSVDGAPRPSGLIDAATSGPADDLKNIKGVGPKLEALLNDLGLFYYRQIAEFSASDVAWLDTKLRFNGRIVRDRWVAQAVELLRRKGG